MAFLEIPLMTEKQINAFNRKIKFAGNDDCWTWTANTSRTKKGYGEFRLYSSIFRAHRVSYFLANGSMPIDLEVDHLCFNPACVNPKHLEAVTGKENLRRKNERAASLKALVEQEELVAA